MFVELSRRRPMCNAASLVASPSVSRARTVSLKAWVVLVLFLVTSAAGGAAQQFDFPEGAGQNDSALSQAMPDLANRVMKSYQEQDRETYLDNLFRLQAIAGQFRESVESIAALRQLRGPKIPGGGEWVNVQYEIWAQAKLKETTEQLPLSEAYRQAFHEIIGRLDDRTSFLAIRSMSAGFIANALQRDRDRKSVV